MVVSMTVVANLRPFKQFIDDLDGEIQRELDEAAKRVAERASLYASQYADTTSEMQGYYVVTPLTDNYADAVGRAVGVNPTVQVVAKQRPRTREGAVVGNVTGHNKINERGGAGRSGRHMLQRAMEDERREFPRRMQTRIRSLAKRHRIGG